MPSGKGDNLKSLNPRSCVAVMYKFIYRSLQLCRRELSLLRGVRTLTSVSSLIFKPPTFVRSTSRLPSISSHSGVRGLWGSPVLAGSPADLDKAREMLNSLTEDPGNETKLKMYALFKQVTEKKNYFFA